MNRCNTNLVVESDKRKSHVHQPLKHGHLQVEVLSKFIYCGTGAQLKKRKNHMCIICFKHFSFHIT